MVTPAEILLITNKADTTADLVVLEAMARGVRLFRLNTEDIAECRCTFHFERNSCVLSTAHREIVVGAGTGIYYRRPEPPFSESDADIAEWTAEQWKDFIFGLEHVHGTRWVSRPSNLRQAENKIFQLTLAQSVGFAVPPTVITNDAAAFAEFRSKNGNLIAKALAGGLVGKGRNARFAYTTALVDEIEPHPEELAPAPTVFQRNISPGEQHRVTVVGADVFGVRLNVSSGLVDWRRSAAPPVLRNVALPADIEDMARHLVAKAGLAFSSMDLILRDREVYFLDLNPNGEWAWIERGAGIPIAGSIVRFLAGQ